MRFSCFEPRDSAALSFALQRLGFGVSSFAVQLFRALRFSVWGLRFGVWGSGFEVWGLGFGVSVFGFRIWV